MMDKPKLFVLRSHGLVQALARTFALEPVKSGTTATVTAGVGVGPHSRDACSTLQPFAQLQLML